MSSCDIQVNLNIDKLEFTVGADDDCKESITSQILDSIDDDNPTFLPVHRDKRLPGYRFTYQFMLDDRLNSYCKISIGPKKDWYAFLRFEFNPSNVGQHGYEILNYVLTYLLEASSVDHLTEATITRLDVALDIQGRRPCDMIIHAGGFGKFGTINNNHSSEIETLYFGHSEGKRSLCIYDKQAEQREKYRIQIPPTTRFEARLRRRMHPIELRSLLSPFDIVRITDGYDLSDTTPLPSDIKFVLAHIQRYGTGNTLRAFDNRSERRRWRKRLLDLGEAEWWDHESLWNDSWADAVNPLLRLFHAPEIPTFRRVRRRRRRVSTGGR